MAQFSVKIIRLNGAVLDENQQSSFQQIPGRNIWAVCLSVVGGVVLQAPILDSPPQPAYPRP